ncbi:predicted protein [Uncinocarpus reesii 1704]|uniref:Uncharacterized protein n=1 Tax=Uncinocarpus reesii (strain UAMH 1704) TaxID=336963 RepID=C4JN28_UNCRE|nr:uncharacterized protein UREG_04236 [Uncinocarpus reesii 1704]EEP79390.1 predicted protein [Uncinocarpus reesii 1704]
MAGRGRKRNADGCQEPSADVAAGDRMPKAILARREGNGGSVGDADGRNGTGRSWKRGRNLIAGVDARDGRCRSRVGAKAGQPGRAGQRAGERSQTEAGGWCVADALERAVRFIRWGSAGRRGGFAADRQLVCCSPTGDAKLHPEMPEIPGSRMPNQTMQEQQFLFRQMLQMKRLFCERAIMACCYNTVSQILIQQAVLVFDGSLQAVEQILVLIKLPLLPRPFRQLYTGLLISSNTVLELKLMEWLLQPFTKESWASPAGQSDIQNSGSYAVHY